MWASSIIRYRHINLRYIFFKGEIRSQNHSLTPSKTLSRVAAALKRVGCLITKKVTVTQRCHVTNTITRGTNTKLKSQTLNSWHKHLL